MNIIPFHSRAKVSAALSDPFYSTGDEEEEEEEPEDGVVVMPSSRGSSEL